MIAIDGRFIVKDISGIGRYSLGLLKGIASLDPPTKISVFINNSTIIPENIINARCFDFIELREDVKKLANQIILPKLLDRYHVKIYHVPDGFASVLPTRARLVLTIHDLIPIRCRKMLWSSKKVLLLPLWSRWLKVQCIKASAIITVSEHSKKDIIDLMNTSEQKIHVIYNGITINEEKINKKKIIEKYNISNNIILYVGRFDPYKNLVILIDAFNQLIKFYPDVTLILAGKLDMRYPETIDRVKQLKLKQKVLFTGNVDDEELASLYAVSSVFIFPSLYEGFGFPSLEAMKYGVPVISSNRTCLTEVLDDAAFFINPTSSTEIAESLLKVLTDKELRNVLISKGKDRANIFTWEKCADKHLKLYEILS